MKTKILMLGVILFSLCGFTENNKQSEVSFDCCTVYLNYYRSDGSIIGTWERCAKPGEACGESINIKYR
jgi:hypothetical protein